jgi:hypothetical protein
MWPRTDGRVSDRLPQFVSLACIFGRSSSLPPSSQQFSTVNAAWVVAGGAAADLVDVAQLKTRIGIPAAKKLRKEELEKAIVTFLRTAAKSLAAEAGTTPASSHGENRPEAIPANDTLDANGDTGLGNGDDPEVGRKGVLGTQLATGCITPSA